MLPARHNFGFSFSLLRSEGQRNQHLVGGSLVNLSNPISLQIKGTWSKRIKHDNTRSENVSSNPPTTPKEGKMATNKPSAPSSVIQDTSMYSEHHSTNNNCLFPPRNRRQQKEEPAATMANKTRGHNRLPYLSTPPSTQRRKRPPSHQALRRFTAYSEPRRFQETRHPQLILAHVAHVFSTHRSSSEAARTPYSTFNTLRGRSAPLTGFNILGGVQHLGWSSLPWATFSTLDGCPHHRRRRTPWAEYI